MASSDQMNEPNGVNPYSSPFAGDAASAPTEHGTGVVAESTVDILRRTRPWVIFLGVLGFIFAGMMALLGVGLVVVGLVGGIADMPAPAFGVLYVLMAFLYLLPSLYLMRFANGIARLSLDPTLTSLDEALEAMRRFWKFVGVMVIVVMLLYFLVAVLAGIGAYVFTRASA